MRSSLLALLALCLAPFTAACNSVDEGDLPDATAQIAPLMGSGVEGVVHFDRLGEGKVRVSVELSGLEPGAHGMHIHEWGDCSAADGSSAGGHFNPDGRPHGAHDDPERHAGDLGNIEADADGVASTTRVLDTAYFSLSGGTYDVRGRAIIVHAEADDFGQPLGNAGGRVGCGIIQAPGDEVAPVLPPASP